MAAPDVASQATSSDEFKKLNELVTKSDELIAQAEAWARGTKNNADIGSNNYEIDTDVTAQNFASKKAHLYLLEQGVYIPLPADATYDSSLTYYGLGAGADNNAKYYAEEARDAYSNLEDLTVTSQTLATGESASVTKTIDAQTGHVNLDFGLPRGLTGETGERGASTVWVDTYPPEDEGYTVWLNPNGTETPVLTTAEQVFYDDEVTYSSGTIGYAMNNMEDLATEVEQAVIDAQAAASRAEAAADQIDAFEEDFAALAAVVDTKVPNPALPSNTGILTVGQTDLVVNTPSFTYDGVYDLIDEGGGNWYIQFITSGTLNVTNWGGCHTLDLCGVGGGGGGGGGYAYYISAAANYASQGGHGGGGFVTTVNAQDVFELNTDYIITIGTGGPGGAGSINRSVVGGNGTAGTATSLTYGDEIIFSAAGGPAGTGGTNTGDGSAGQGGQAQFIFNSSAYPNVSGANRPGSYGGGGSRGTAQITTGATANPGTAGAAGLLVIRNHHETITTYEWKEGISYTNDIDSSTIPLINNVPITGSLSLADLKIAPQSGSQYYYSKPVGGIPNSDLDVSVNLSLSAADSAVQHIKLNGITRSVDENNTIDLGTILTEENWAQKNYLDNSWFLVNQRGITKFNDSGSPTASDGTYICDRWKVIEDEGQGNRVIEISSGLLKISTANTYNANKSFTLGQLIDDEVWQSIGGETITISVYYSLDGSLYSDGFLTLTCPEYGSSVLVDNQAQLVTNYGWGVKLSVVYVNTKPYLAFEIIWQGNGWNPSTSLDSDIYIKKAKLETGYNSTIEYDTAPFYSDELKACKRYLQYYGGKSAADSKITIVGQGIAASATELDWVFRPEVDMIAAPSITASVELVARRGIESTVTNVGTVDSAAIASSTNFEGVDGMYLQTTASNLTASVPYYLILPATAAVASGETEIISYLSFSAEP